MTAPHVLPSTARAILVARVLLSLPVVGTLLAHIFWIASPASDWGYHVTGGFASPHRPTEFVSSVIFYWWGTMVGATCLVISFLLQAYAKRPQYRLPQYLVDGVEETDHIFTWDAIFEMVLWAGCVMACASLQLWSDTFSTVSDKMFNVFVSAVIVTMGLLLFVMFMYSIINSMREYLSPSAFRAFIVKAAGDCFLLSILFTFISVYGSTSLQTNELPFAYAGALATIVPDELATSLSCPNETAAIAVLEAIPCNVKPLCGFSTWQVACYRIQLANPVRAYYLFGGPLFSIWALVLWACYTLFSQGNANIKAVV